tara:strand:+ start:818 stop:1144 length:327 start_codon:yes stop_codon:yes gene_type:complete
MVVTAVVAGAAATTYVAVKSANDQRRVQEQALANQRQANERAEARAVAEEQRSQQEYNRANRQDVDVSETLDRSKLAAKQGASGTLLTGGMGVDPNELNLSKNTLLGG